MDFLTNINLNSNELQKAVIHNASTAPQNPKVGQIYFNTTDQMMYQYKRISTNPDTYAWETVGEHDTNTTYTFAGGTNKFTVTPSDGSAQDVTVTPSITNNVTHSSDSVVANNIVTWNANAGASANAVVKDSGKAFTTDAPSGTSTDTTIPTSAAVWSAVNAVPKGTVTSVGLQNATNGGLTVTDSPVTSSGTITVGHSNVLTSAQTTSGIYPIKIDKNGHITEYGTALGNVSASAAGTLPAFSNTNKSSTAVGSSNYVWDATQGKYAQLPSTAFSDNNTTYTFANGTNGFTVTPSGGSAQTVTVTPSITNNVTYSGTLTDGHVPVFDSTSGVIEDSGVTITTTAPASTSDDTTVPTSAAVDSAITSAINALPEPMVFKGSVGTGGTKEWSALPTASSANEGWTYKVINKHTTAPICEVGDTIISDGTNWVVIPSGDEPSGTVTSVGIQNASNGGLSVSGSPITSSGTITIGLASAYGDTKNPYGSKTANTVLAAPNGSNGTPSFRALVADDIPDLSDTYQPAGNYKTTQTAKTDPSASGTSTTFIATLSQDTNGVITATKKTVDFSGYKTTQTAVTDPTAHATQTSLTFIDTISQDTNGVITPTKKRISYDTTPTEDSDSLVTSGGVYAAIQQVSGGAVTKKIKNNPALTSSGGAWTWTISGTDILGTADISVTVYNLVNGASNPISSDIPAGAIVNADVVVNQSTGVVTITINDVQGATTLPANTFKAVMMG